MIIQKPTVLPVLHSRSRRRGGFTLTEIAIVLGIISVILGAIWVAAGQVNEKARISQATTAFGAVTQNMTALLQGGYGMSAGVFACGAAAPPACPLTTKMITAGVIPQWLGSGATASNPWDPTGLYMQWVSDNPRTYRITYYNVTHDGCLGLIMQTTNCTPGQSGCPIGVSSGGTKPGPNAYAAPTYPAAPPLSLVGAPMSSSTAETVCNANVYTGAAPNSVEFDFTQ